MTREEMLERLRLTEPQLREMLAEFRKFYNRLHHDAQRAAIDRSLPIAEALKAFDSDVTEKSLLELFQDDRGKAIMICVPLHHKHHPAEPDTNNEHPSAEGGQD
jgi:hypothetical protein